MPSTLLKFKNNKPAGFRQLPVWLLACCLAGPLPASADDIEVYISAPVSLPKPNILFVLDRSGSMRYNPEGSVAGPSEESRMDQLKEAMQTILTNEELYNINAGILSYTTSPWDITDLYLTIEHEFVDAGIAANRTSLIDAVNDLEPYGGTPTTLAFEQAVSWMQGLDGYSAPAEYQCQVNRVILLTDGIANNSPYTTNPFDTFQDCEDDYPFYYDIPTASSYNDLNGICSKEIIATGYTTDIKTSGTDVEGNSWDGLQNLVTDTIGFHTASNPYAEDFLREIIKGQNETLDDDAPSDGDFYTASSVNDLVQVFSSLLTEAVIATEVAYSAPSIPVNTDNGIINKNEFYLPLFKPEFKTFWKGNLKKYRIEYDSNAGVLEIKDKNGLEALNEDLSFKDGISSYWGNTDGADILAGGVAAVVNTQQRTIYTESGAPLASDILANIAPSGTATQGETVSGGVASRAIDGNTDGDWNNGSVTMTDNEDIDNWWRLDLGETRGDLDSIIVWNRTDANSNDLNNFTLQLKDGENNTIFSYDHNGTVTLSATIDLPPGTKARYVVIEAKDNNPLTLAEVEVFQNNGYYWFVDAQPTPASPEEGRMGAPIHSAPAVYQESDTSTVVFIGTSDGVMHAFRDTGDSVTELWGFIPDTLVGLLDDFRENIETDDQNSIIPPKYGIDGPVELFDVQEGAQQKRLLVFGMRRGGNNYYALDVTDVENPVLKWKIQGGSGDFPRLGQTWGRPSLTRLEMLGYDTPALIFPGGYDPTQDQNVGARQDDATGNAIYIVDALSGTKLKSISSSAADLNISDMRNAITADLSLVDMDADGATDRLYAADTGGRIIRVDFDQGGMTGDVIADINDGSVAGNRQFFNRPVVAYMGSYLAITIGSGRRPFIFDDTVSDRFYMIKDFAVWGPPADGEYSRVIESMLTDHTAGFDPSMTWGWYFDLKHIGTDASGNPVSVNEKSVTRAVVYDGIVYFNTIAGSKEIKAVSCTPSTTSTSAYFYAVKINTGDAAIASFDGNSELDEVDDRSRMLKTPTIPEAPFVYVGSKLVVGDDGQNIQVALDEMPVSPGVGEDSEPQPNRYRAIYWESSLGE